MRVAYRAILTDRLTGEVLREFEASSLRLAIRRVKRLGYRLSPSDPIPESPPPRAALTLVPARRYHREGPDIRLLPPIRR